MLELKWPKHKCGMYVSHNEYRDSYHSIEIAVQDIEAVELRAGTKSEDIWYSLEERQTILDTRELWELQWYPNTPIGSYIVRASSFELLIKYANEVEEDCNG